MCCELCNLLHHNEISFKNNFISTDNVIYESKNFVIVPDKLPVSQMHSLIISKRCVCGMANLNKQELCELEELVQMHDAIVEKNMKKKPSHFEHGSVSKNGNGGNSIYHFHYHNILLEIPLENEISQKISTYYEKINSYTEIEGKKNDYLLYENENDKKFIYNLKTNIVSQFLRKMVYEHTRKQSELSDYDWKNHENQHLFMENKQRLENMFRSNYCNII